MIISPKILGAAALVPIFGFTCGALAAAAIETKPVTGGKEDYLADLPAQHMQTASPEQARAMKARANHYPLETPHGTIEVAELAYHGRLRNRLPERALYEARFGEGYLYEAAAGQKAEPGPTAELPDMVWPVDPSAVTEISPHEGAPLDAGQGGPRMINVAAELATRP